MANERSPVITEGRIGFAGILPSPTMKPSTGWGFCSMLCWNLIRSSRIPRLAEAACVERLPGDRDFAGEW